MTQETFKYSYSAKEQNEVQKIRKKYLPREENRLEELRRLDDAVQSSGMLEALVAGIGGMLLFGLGLCLNTQIIANGTFFVVLGVLLEVAGIVGMLAAYPVYRFVFSKTKARMTPRILELATQLSGDNKEV